MYSLIIYIKSLDILQYHYFVRFLLYRKNKTLG